MLPFKKIVICGVGLIGGSVAISLREAGFKGKIYGLEKNATLLARAYERGLVDSKDLTVEETCRDADLLMLSVPVAQTANVLKTLLPHLPENVLITDTGSTKSDVVSAARSVLGSRISKFIPAHPIAGRETNGPDAAISGLYTGKKAVIAPLPENSPEDIAKIADLWDMCGAVIHYLTPEEHDQVFATVSHMPHVLAYALVDYVARHPKTDKFFQYAASGFRDFTRIASSSPEMWRDITLANRSHLLTEIDAYLAELKKIREMVASSDGSGIEDVYSTAQKARMAWLNTIESSEK